MSKFTCFKNRASLVGALALGLFGAASVASAATYRLVMAPVDIVVSEKTSASGSAVDYPISTNGDHGFNWSYDSSNGTLRVGIATSTTARKGSPAPYLWRKARFKVAYYAVSDAYAQPGGASWSVGFQPYQDAGYALSANTTGANYAGYYQLNDPNEHGFSVTTNYDEHFGYQESFSRSFSSFSGTPDNWTSETTYVDFATKPVTAQSDAELASGSYANAATSAESIYLFSAPNYTTSEPTLAAR